MIHQLQQQTYLPPARQQVNTSLPPCAQAQAPPVGPAKPCSAQGNALSLSHDKHLTRILRHREDLPTLRVTNVSEDTTDNDLRDLFSNFGRVARVYIGRDRETGIGKGYAFVSFEDRAVAQKAMEKVHGMGACFYYYVFNRVDK